MSGGNELPGTSTDGLAGEHYRAVQHSIGQLEQIIGSTTMTRAYGEMSSTQATLLGMSGLYLSASLAVHVTAAAAVEALELAKVGLEELASALLAQGA